MTDACPILTDITLTDQVQELYESLTLDGNTTFNVPIVRKEPTLSGGKQAKKVKKGGTNDECSLTVPVPEEVITLIQGDPSLRRKLAKFLMVVGVVQKNYRYLLKDEIIQQEFRIAQLDTVIKSVNDSDKHMISAELDDDNKVILSLDRWNGDEFDKYMTDLNIDEDIYTITLQITKSDTKDVTMTTQTADGEGGMYINTYKIPDGKTEDEHLNPIFKPFTDEVQKIQAVLNAWEQEVTEKEADDLAKSMPESPPKEGGGVVPKPKTNIPKAVRQHFRIPANLRVSQVPEWMARTYSKAELTSLIGLPTEDARRSFARLTKDKMIAMILRR